jgi:hypothetical protein
MASETNNVNAPFGKGDRVKRKNQNGCYGTVVEVRTEVTKTNAQLDERSLLVSVQWDNGTYSYFTPAALQTV